MDDEEKLRRHNRIKWMLIGFTVVAVLIFLGIFFVFAAQVKSGGMN